MVYKSMKWGEKASKESGVVTLKPLTVPNKDAATSWLRSRADRLHHRHHHRRQPSLASPSLASSILPFPFAPILAFSPVRVKLLHRRQRIGECLFAYRRETWSRYRLAGV